MTVTLTDSKNIGRKLVYILLALVPFHAFLTVYISSFIGHYTALRLWDAAILIVLAGIAVFLLMRDGALRSTLAANTIVRLIALYALLSILLTAVGLFRGEVSIKAASYGLLSNLRYLLWFIVVLIVCKNNPPSTKTIKRLICIPASIVVVFAVLQFAFLPHNFLAHFGYNENTTIAPIETINHNANFIRVQSTLRGANPLGAYLIIIVAALGVYGLASKRKFLYVVSLVATLFALFASGSRSAWIGALLAGFTALWLYLPSRRAKLIAGNSLLGVLLLFGGLALLFKENVQLQNALLHTQEHSQVATSSNDAHLSATKAGIEDVIHQPFGAGPGSAGPASVYNAKEPARIAENYYVQIAQETGWIGLALFVAILVFVAKELYRKSIDSPLARIALASFIGISFVCLLSHAWSDDTLAFVWWGIAALSLTATREKKKHAIQTN